MLPPLSPATSCSRTFGTDDTAPVIRTALVHFATVNGTRRCSGGSITTIHETKEGGEDEAIREAKFQSACVSQEWDARCWRSYRRRRHARTRRIGLWPGT